MGCDVRYTSHKNNQVPYDLFTRLEPIDADWPKYLLVVLLSI